VNSAGAPVAAEEFTITCNDEPITILLVDDDEDCRALIRDAISECKVSNTVFECRDGQDALDFLYRRGKKHIDRSALFNLPPNRLRWTIHDTNRRTVFCLEHRDNFLEGRLQAWSRSNNQISSLNTFPRRNDAYKSSYRCHCHTKFTNACHCAPLVQDHRIVIRIPSDVNSSSNINTIQRICSKIEEDSLIGSFFTDSHTLFV